MAKNDYMRVEDVCVQRLSSPTCVFPPVLSWTMVRDMEQLIAKHWKNPPIELLRPRAMNSYQNMRIILYKHIIEHIYLSFSPSPHLVAVHTVSIL